MDRTTSRRGESRGFRYQERSADTTRKRAEQSGSQFDSYVLEEVRLWRPNDGDNTIRILPPTWDRPEHFGVDIYVHYGVGPDNEAYLCLDKMKGEPCPVCEERKKALDEGDDDYAAQLKPNRRVLVYIIDRDHEKDGVQAWSMPWTIDRDICKLAVDKKTGDVLPIDHPDHGYDVEFERKGKAERTEYIGVAIARRESPLGEDSWLDYAQNLPLPDALKYYSYEHIQRVLCGGGKSRPSDDDGKEQTRDHREPSRRQSRDDGPTWESIHAMSMRELEKEADKIGIDPDKASGQTDLADWICEELKIAKPREPERHSSRDDATSRERLRNMREGRD